GRARQALCRCRCRHGLAGAPHTRSRDGGALRSGDDQGLPVAPPALQLLLVVRLDARRAAAHVPGARAAGVPVHRRRAGGDPCGDGRRVGLHDRPRRAGGAGADPAATLARGPPDPESPRGGPARGAARARPALLGHLSADGSPMRISTDGLSADGGHTLLKQVIVPRPIAWITTLRPNGVVNLAPFSCYSFICFQPMLLCLSFE